MRLFRARPWRGVGPAAFDALDSSGSVKGPKGWRYNDLKTEILYAAEVEALAVLEVAVRPGFEAIRHILVATIEIPDGSLVDLSNMGIVLPGNWNSRPAADDSRGIARQFLEAVAKLPAGAPRPAGLRVPSVLSATDYNVLVDPSRRHEYRVVDQRRLPFSTLRETTT